MTKYENCLVFVHSSFLFRYWVNCCTVDVQNNEEEEEEKKENIIFRFCILVGQI